MLACRNVVSFEDPAPGHCGERLRILCGQRRRWLAELAKRSTKSDCEVSGARSPSDRCPCREDCEARPCGDCGREAIVQGLAVS